MRAAIAILALLLAFGGVARADDRELARKEFAAGQAADARKDWQTAIEHYLRANDLMPHPFALFNIATDYERLGKLREATTWYERYLAASEDANDKQKVMKLMREIALRPAAITVRSIPAGAQVKIDDRPVGTTPYTGQLGGGFHRVTVEHEGQREDRDVRVEFAEPVNVDFTLRGAAGILHVVGAPFGALVTVDGLPAGSMPARLQLAPGEHAVRITAYGYAPYETTAIVTANGEAEVRAQLVRALGMFDTARPALQLGYLLGVAGGADAKGNGGLLLAEFGVRVGKYDGAIRVGKSGPATALDFLVRVAFSKTKLAPFLGAGYSTVISTSDDAFATTSTSAGYLLMGGLRYDLARGEKAGVSLLAETGIRYYAGLTDTSAHDALVVPFMASLEIVYR
ncbi:MAG: PEGA domain-containing protein [Deltaproteobacteria bacterium]|nr:PEGA domain-containing protein [Deltaproteobacteria bacterium]MCW5806341.1 PEGA domain-containing protein [Deltaproteobacteria bacterium]